MKIVILTALMVATFAVVPPRGQSRPASARSLVFANATVLDGVSDQPLRNLTIVITDGRIERIGATSGAAHADAEVIDLDGRWVLPGLIDVHAHLRDLASARAALRAGVTTVRSLGADHFVEVGIREMHRGGAADLPAVVAAGYHVRPRVAEAFFLDVPALRALIPGLSSAADARRVASALVARAVDVIKVMATERAGIAETDFRRRALSDEQLAAVVAEASAAGIPVAAHAHTDEGGLAAVRAGVRTIEHGTLLSEATLRLMKDRNTCLVPTIAFWLDMIDAGGEYDHPVLAARAREMLPRLRETIATARRLGVRIAAGSDMRYSAGVRQVSDEIAALIESGMPPSSALQSAASTAAACLGFQGRTGVIKAGYEADLIVVADDPRVDLNGLREPLMVVNDGRVAVDRVRRPVR